MPDASEAQVALCLNVGSSSLKFALFEVDASSERCLASGTVTQLEDAFQVLAQQRLPKPSVVGHRVVHGGREHVLPTLIDDALIESLKRLVPLAPLHLPAAISGIELTAKRLPGLPQVACFDTAFHAQLPEHTAHFALPTRLYDAGVRRYGFHGLSYEYVLSTLGTPAPARVIIAHLGNGASLAAIRDGKSIDTTMGLTPGGGILMGTRAGDLDPGLMLYLLREQGYTPESLEHLLERESGLLGVAGSADVRELSARFEHEASARLALKMLGYAVRKTIGGYIAALGGLDVLVFTGGIGEHSPRIRAEACQGLEAFGVAIDETRNARGERAIHSPGSASQVLVIETDEDRMIARHSVAVLRDRG